MLAIFIENIESKNQSRRMLKLSMKGSNFQWQTKRGNKNKRLQFYRDESLFFKRINQESFIESISGITQAQSSCNSSILLQTEREPIPKRRQQLLCTRQGFAESGACPESHTICTASVATDKISTLRNPGWKWKWYHH